jgi:hypothetical protein
LRNTNVFSSSPRYPNIVFRGQGEGGSLLHVSFVFTNTTFLIYMPMTILTWVLALVCQLFQGLFSRIVCAECKIFHLNLVFLSLLKNEMSYELHIAHDLGVDYNPSNHNKIVDKEVDIFREMLLNMFPMLTYTHFICRAQNRPIPSKSSVSVIFQNLIMVSCCTRYFSWCCPFKPW